MSPERPSVHRVLPWAELAGFIAAAAAVVALEVSRHPEYVRHPQLLLAYRFDPETTLVGASILAAPLLWWRGRPRSRQADKAARKDTAGATRKRTPGTQYSGLSTQYSDAATQPTEAVRNQTHGGATLDSSPALPQRSAAVQSTTPLHIASSLTAWLLNVLLFTFSVALTARAGLPFRGMPPAFHDEYSYVFQAKTFLSGRLYFPQHRNSEFFDQMHVLNDQGVFASRFFPGVGLWLAPWVALGRPYWGQYVAGGLVVVLVFWIGRELGAAFDRETPDSGADSVDEYAERPAGWPAICVGIAAAVCCAVSPAMLLFGNLLLSHHATMLGLAAFVLCYFRALRTDGLAWPIAGGAALGFAMLCRPLTACGFALPFGLHLLWLVARCRLARCTRRVAGALTPLVMGIALLVVYNALLTGDPFRTPYGLYTRTYTPNHIYGFYNVSRGQKIAGPKVLENYNRWAEELTVPRAFRLLVTRAASSSLWSTGPTSLAWTVPVLVALIPWLPVQMRLLAAAVVGLHSVYFPFAFEGIFGLSYVFESVPVLCLLVAGLGVWLGRHWLAQGSWVRPLWLAVFLTLSLSGSWHRLMAPGPDGGIAQVQFARSYYAGFERLLRAAGVEPPALVFIKPDPADRHRDLVTNSPSLDDPILRARDRGPLNERLAKQYPDRETWLYNADPNSAVPGLVGIPLVRLRDRRASPPQATAP